MAETTSTTWQDTCAQTLRDAVALGGAAGRIYWDKARQDWVTARAQRPVLKGINLTGADLRGYDFSRAWFGECLFGRANLTGANLSQSIFRDCDFTGANLSSASFKNADLKHPGNRLLGTVFDDATDMSVNRGQLPIHIDVALRYRAEVAWRSDAWRLNRPRTIAYRFFSTITDFGFGFRRLLLASGLIVVVFAFIFWLLLHSEYNDTLQASARYFLNLSDDYNGQGTALEWLGLIESALGLVFFAILISVFTKKYTDL